MHKENRRKLVDNLEKREYIKSSKVRKAFLEVPREEFVPSKVKKEAYADRPLPIGQGQTISAPSMIAIMLEVIDLESGQKVLEIGTGSGYNATLLAETVGTEGEVFTVERLKSIGETGRKNLKDSGYEEVEVIIGDGTKGYSKEAPWDRILLTACAPEVPDPLVKQLGEGGKLAAPVGQHYMSQTLTVIKKLKDGGTEETKHGGCAFVPLVGKHGWDEGEAR